MTFGEMICAKLTELRAAGKIVEVRIDDGPRVALSAWTPEFVTITCWETNYGREAEILYIRFSGISKFEIVVLD